MTGKGIVANCWYWLCLVSAWLLGVISINNFSQLLFGPTKAGLLFAIVGHCLWGKFLAETISKDALNRLIEEKRQEEMRANRDKQ